MPLERPGEASTVNGLLQMSLRNGLLLLLFGAWSLDVGLYSSFDGFPG
jgi:hypothetical protein